MKQGLGLMLVVGTVAALSTGPGKDRASGGAPQIATSPPTLAVGVLRPFAPGNGGMVPRGPKLPPPALDTTLPDPPGPIVVGKMGVVVAGDTLPYTISWGPGARATSYAVSLSAAASNGVWSVARDSNASGSWVTGNGVGALPSSAAVTFTSVKTWLTAVPWDSATFTVTVFSQNSVGSSATGSTRIWKVLRRPGPPGPITVDSSAIPVALLVLPNTTTLALGSSRTACAFKQFGNGAIAQWTADKPACDSIYAAYVPMTAQALVTAAQQAHTDSLTKTCVTWATNNVLAVSLTPNAPCSAAVSVTGLALTMRADQLPFRYASVRASGPILAVSPSGLATCLRAGLAVVTATVDGVVARTTITCRDPWPAFLASASR